MVWCYAAYTRGRCTKGNAFFKGYFNCDKVGWAACCTSRGCFGSPLLDGNYCVDAIPACCPRPGRPDLQWP